MGKGEGEGESTGRQGSGSREGDGGKGEGGEGGELPEKGREREGKVARRRGEEKVEDRG